VSRRAAAGSRAVNDSQNIVAHPEAVIHGADDFRILLVCTANLCRSPMAQFLLEAAVSTAWSGAGRWSVKSAGVRAADHRPMHQLAITALGQLGCDGSLFRTRRLQVDMLQSADLVLTATRAHRSDVARMHPSVMGRLFTMNQFGYLLAHAPALHSGTTARHAGEALIVAAVAARGRVRARTVDDDLDDPVNKPVRAFRQCAQQLSANFAQTQRLLTGP
jgi:protein-tyrosine phosphatase